MAPVTPPTIFISYSHRDAAWVEKLRTFLTPLIRSSELNIWSTDQIPTGTDWKAGILNTLKEANLAILLLSPDFLASDFIVNEELPALLSHYQEGDLVVLPILVSACAWQYVSWLAGLQFLNDPSKPLDTLSGVGQDRAYLSIATRIAELAGALNQREVKESARASTPVDTGESPDSNEPPGIDAPEFFISHAKADGDFAELLQLRLERRGYKAWIDFQRLDPGVDWRESIDDAVAKSAAVIVVLSPESRESEYVTYEWAYAWGRGVRIIPLMLRTTPIHPRLETLQFLDFSNRGSRPWTKLFEILCDAQEKGKAKAPRRSGG